MAIISLNPRSRSVAADETAFLRLLGECVSQWAFLDRELFHVAQAALGTDATRTAIVFYGAANIATHLSLIDRLMKHGLSEDHFLKQWRPLHKKIKHHLETRSVYAHQPINRTGTSKNGRPFYYYAIHIEPAEQLLGRTHQGLSGKQELVAKDLAKHAHSLEKLVGDVSAFRSFFKKHSRFKETTCRAP